MAHLPPLPGTPLYDRTGGIRGIVEAVKRDVQVLLEAGIDVVSTLNIQHLESVNDTVEALKNLDRTSSRFVIHEGIVGQIRRGPLVTVLCMGPFNYPLNETFTTLIPALIMGNTVVFKPPRMGILLYRPLLEAFRDAFPPGVVNTVYGEGRRVVGPLMASGKIDVLAFIGSAAAADTLKKRHPAPHRLRSVLGLGAKNPAIILPDADLEFLRRLCPRALILDQGETVADGPTAKLLADSGLLERHGLA